MRIRMLTTAAGPGGAWQARREYDVPDAIAKLFVKSGAAVAVGGAETAARPVGRVAARVTHAPAPAELPDTAIETPAGEPEPDAPPEPEVVAGPDEKSKGGKRRK